MKRCDKPALWQAENSYRECRECYGPGHSEPFAYMPAQSPGPHGKCDKPLDGMGDAPWYARKDLPINQ